MSQNEFDFIARNGRKLRSFWRLPNAVWWVARIGTAGYPPRVRRRLAVTNIIAAMVSLMTIPYILASRSLLTLPVAPSDYQAAARLCDRAELGLRAGDSLHIAVAVTNGLPIATLDKVMEAACGLIAHPTTPI